MKAFLAMIGLALVLQDAIRVEVELRESIVSVRDHEGKPVNGLQIRDFIVEEGDLVGNIAQVEGFRPPISFGILIDTRDRGSEGLPLYGRRLEIEGINPAYNAGIAGTKKLLANPNFQDEVALMSFRDSLKIDQNFTPKVEEVAKRIPHLRQPQFYGQALGPSGISVLAALDRVFDKMKRATFTRRVLVVFAAASGQDYNIDISGKEPVPPSGITVYTLGFDGSGDAIGRSNSIANSYFPKMTLAGVASKSGGFSEMFGLTTVEEQKVRGSEFMDKVLDDLTGEYILRWYRKNPGGRPSGKILVRTIAPEYRVETVTK